ncbi:MAG: DUF4019 domain-containing protein [Gammaproteobacteria bacterium]|nr:DUF4019 domain-containing protein [Gammaproteobacteria bacterium]MDE2348096.1 DUF4019 domain-containing protein [Gammaproteobacteria bacterium]
MLIGLLSGGIANAQTASPPTRSDVAAEAAAEAAAAQWLALVDGGKYDRSWMQAGDYLRRATTEAAWASSVAHARGICGALLARRLESAYATSYLPDAPPGYYVVLHYASRFAHNSPATETLTLIQDPKGSWRVVGYYIS